MLPIISGVVNTRFDRAPSRGKVSSAENVTSEVGVLCVGARFMSCQSFPGDSAVWHADVLPNSGDGSENSFLEEGALRLLTNFSPVSISLVA